MDPSSVIWDETLPPGGYAGHLVPRGSTIRFADLEGDGCCQLLLFRADQRSERLNVADTMKIQWQAYLGTGSLILSGLGRVLASVRHDTSGRHDGLCGGSTRAHNERCYGDGAAWGPSPASRELLALAAAKHALTRRDLPPVFNLFKGARVAPDGTIIPDVGPSAPSALELRAEMDLLVLVAVTPHVLDDRVGYPVTGVRCTAWRSLDQAGGDSDPFRASTPERRRAFLNTDDLLAGMSTGVVA